MMVIHYWVVHLTNSVKLLDNKVPVHPVSILCHLIESLSCIPVIQFLLKK